VPENFIPNSTIRIESRETGRLDPGGSARHIPDVTSFLPAAPFFATALEIGLSVCFASIAVGSSIIVFAGRTVFDLQLECLSGHRSSPNKQWKPEPWPCKQANRQVLKQLETRCSFKRQFVRR
jgi:hypothetical protein